MMRGKRGRCATYGISYYWLASQNVGIVVAYDGTSPKEIVRVIFFVEPAFMQPSSTAAPCHESPSGSTSDLEMHVLQLAAQKGKLSKKKALRSPRVK